MQKTWQVNLDPEPVLSLLYPTLDSEELPLARNIFKTMSAPLNEANA